MFLLWLRNNILNQILAARWCWVLCESTDLHFEQPAAVRLEVAVVNLAHGVDVLVSDLLGDRPLIGQKELIEKSTAGQTETESVGC